MENAPERIESLCLHLRRMANGPCDAIDADRLIRAADEIERRTRADDEEAMAAIKKNAGWV